MVRDEVPVLVGGKTGDRLEVIVLIEIKEHITVVQVPYPGDRQFLRIVTPRGGRPARGSERDGQRCNEQREATHGKRAYSQSLISNSGCIRRCRSLILSSRYFAPMPFSNLSV